jgi:hypothetical protein
MGNLSIRVGIFAIRQTYREYWHIQLDAACAGAQNWRVGEPRIMSPWFRSPANLLRRAA